MTVVAARPDDGGAASVVRRVPGFRPDWTWLRRERVWLVPSLVAVLNGLAFLVVSPGVGDIFAARARQSAASHGVGLTYWFAWFGGGTTPGNYSVLTPYLSTLIGAGLLGAIATAAITPLTWLAVRGTAHPVAGVWIVSLSAGLNLWSGRVPFALGCATTVVTVIFLVQRKIVPAALFAVLTVLFSPVSGAFIGVVVAGVFLVRPQHRRVCLVTLLALGASLIGVAVAFGQPGPESFTFVQMLQVCVTLLLFLLASPPDYLRSSIWIGVLASPLLFVIPNGMGDNVLRLPWYCLPAVIVATSGRRLRVALLAVALAVAFSGNQSIRDVVRGTEKPASVDYYKNLITELKTMKTSLLNYRLEVVEDGTHTAAYALLDYAMLARGWEYQDDREFNSPLASPTLDATTYKLWLQDNAVGYVAIARAKYKDSPEYSLVSQRRPAYLAEVWHDPDWTLYRVGNPNPIVGLPQSVTSRSQSEMAVDVRCGRCSFSVRVRYSKYLNAMDPATNVKAKLVDDGSGWTTMTTTASGDYVLSGKLFR